MTIIKSMIGLFLLMSLVLAAAFPQSIYGSSLELEEASGDMSSGEAAYYSSDYSEGAYVTTMPMSSSEWSSTDYSDWTQTSEPGMTCYYTSGTDTDEYGDFAYAYMDCYKDGTYFMIDTYVDGATPGEAVYEALVVAQEMVSSSGGSGNGGGNGNGGSGNGGSGGGNGGDDYDPNACCPTGLALITLAGAGVFGFKN